MKAEDMVSCGVPVGTDESPITVSANGFIITFRDIRGPLATGNSLEFMADAERGLFYVCTENPWAGDSETGFGAEASFQLTLEQAEALCEFLRANTPI